MDTGKTFRANRNKILVALHETAGAYLEGTKATEDVIAAYEKALKERDERIAEIRNEIFHLVDFVDERSSTKREISIRLSEILKAKE